MRRHKGVPALNVTSRGDKSRVSTFYEQASFKGQRLCRHTMTSAGHPALGSRSLPGIQPSTPFFLLLPRLPVTAHRGQHQPLAICRSIADGDYVLNPSRSLPPSRAADTGGGGRGGSESFETFYNPSRGPCLKTCHRNCVNFTSGGARKERIIRNQQ